MAILEQDLDKLADSLAEQAGYRGRQQRESLDTLADRLAKKAGYGGKAPPGKGAATPIPTPLRLFGSATTEGIHPELEQRIERARKRLAEQGIRLQLSSPTLGGKRTLEQQEALFRKYGQGRAAKPSPRAPHVRGIALDLAAVDTSGRNRIRDEKVRELLQSEGLVAPLAHEPWHWEFRGGRKVATPIETPTRKQKAQPVRMTQRPGVPLSTGLLPVEKEWEAVEGKWQSLAPALRAPGYRPAEGGPLEKLIKQRAVTALRLRDALPQIRERLATARQKALSPQATPADKAAYQQLAQRVKKYERTVSGSLRLPERLRNQPLFNSVYYEHERNASREPLNTPFENFLDDLWEGAKKRAPWLAEKAQELFGFSGRSEEAQKRVIARAKLQKQGVIKPLPSPTPGKVAQQTAEKNRLLRAIQDAFTQLTLGHTVMPMKVNYERLFARDPRFVRRVVEKQLGEKLTPWQEKIYPTLIRNVIAEIKLNDPVLRATATDAMVEIISDLVGGAGAKLGIKAAEKAVSKGLLRPVSRSLSKRGAGLLRKGLFSAGGGAAGGAAAGGSAGAILEAARASREGKSGREVAKAGVRGLVRGAGHGLVIGTGLGAGGLALGAAARRVGPALGVLREKARVTKAGLKGKTALASRRTPALTKPTKPQGRPEGRPAHPGPHVTVDETTTIRLRETTPEQLAGLAESLEQAGKSREAEAVRDWEVLSQSYEASRKWEMPPQLVSEWQARWNRRSNPLRQAHDALEKHSENPKYDERTRDLLREAADEMVEVQKEIFRRQFDTQTPEKVPPPHVSTWRKLDPEVKASLPKDVQRSLMVLDGVNSLKVLDPDATFQLKGRKPTLWEAQVDDLFERAQAKLADEWEKRAPESLRAPEAPRAGEELTPTTTPEALRATGEGAPEALGMLEPEVRAPEAEPVVREPVIQPEVPEPGAVPTAYQAAVRRALQKEQPFGALTSSPRLRTAAEIAAERAVPEPAATRTKPPIELAEPSGAPGARRVSGGVVLEAPPAPTRKKGTQALELPAPPVKRTSRKATLPEEAPPAPTRKKGMQAPELPAPGAKKAGIQVPEPQKERRADLALRKKIDEMTPEEKSEVIALLRKEGLRSHVTDLQNRVAYNLSDKKPWQAEIDADSLKWWNDEFAAVAGDEGGDALLRGVAEALRRSGLDESDIYHISGDEFVVQGESREALSKALRKANNLLKNSIVEFKQLDGTTRRFKGAEFSYGIGELTPGEKPYLKANVALKKNKARRVAAGLRGTRGQPPPRLVEIGTETGPIKRQVEGARAPSPARKARLTGEQVLTDSQSAQKRIRQGEVTILPSQGEKGTRRVMSDTPHAVQTAKVKRKVPCP